MEWTDTHCHIGHRQFASDRDAVLENARKLGLAAMIVPAITLGSNAALRQIPSLDQPWIYFAAGVHPNHVERSLRREQLEGFIDSRTVAIGEIGLDFFRTQEPEQQELQREMFKMQIELAIEYDLPVILHIRDAWDPALEILRGWQRKFSGVAHCFAGTWLQAEAFLDLGFALGVGGVITKEDPDLTETVRKMPLDRLLLETDAPFLAPKGRKGRNTPENIPLIAETIAMLRGVDTERIMEITTENARRIFRLGK